MTSFVNMAPNQVIITSPGPQGIQGIQGEPGVGFPYTGSAIISGSVQITGSIITTTGYINANVLNENITTQTGFNYMLIGPITANQPITITPNTFLKII